MLVSLSIRDVVLIERLDLNFDAGLNVLTGETGAGKSILLDSLGLALGGRSEVRLIRKGADKAQVTAAFEPPPNHPIFDLLRDQGFDEESSLILRRVVGQDGRTRAFVNDQPASVNLLRQIGDLLVEVHGQNDQRGLLDTATHRATLDAFGGLRQYADNVRQHWSAWRQAEEELASLQDAQSRAASDEDFLRHAVTELETLAPEAGEEEALQSERLLLMNAEKLVSALNEAQQEIAGQRPVDNALQSAQRALLRVSDKAAGALDPAIEALERAMIECAEAVDQIAHAGTAIDGDGARLQSVDDRLFALRDLARKHDVPLADLPALTDQLRAQLATIEDLDGALARARAQAEAARQAYCDAAEDLSARRQKAAQALNKAVGAELPPLKLERADLLTVLTRLEEADWGADGIDRIAFQIATNPGATPGPLNKIASGGELSRIMLALKVVLSRTSAASTLVFDEVDAGIGGATAAAVGTRLTHLGQDVQVLVVTHSPQVAARGSTHLRVLKSAPEDSKKGGDKKASTATVTTDVQTLTPAARREEIARMLSGQDITDAARAAADALLSGEAAP